MELSDIFQLSNCEMQNYYANDWKFTGFLNLAESKEGYVEELKNYPSEVSALLERCERLVNNQFVYDNDWDMERCPIPVSMPLGEIDWHLIPFGDQEWMFMLNRHSFLIDLVIGYLLTKDERYSGYIHDFILESIANNPLTEETMRTTWRTLDVGIRLLNWVKILEVFLPEKLFSEDELAQVMRSVEEQMHYLNDHLRIERSCSNWQVMEIMGLLCACAAFPEVPGADTMRKNGEYYLVKALHLQVEQDGLQREQSFMYHHEVLLSLLQITLLYHRNQLTVPDEVENYAKLMAYASEKVMKPDGTQAAFGDSDIENMVGILQLSEYVLHEAILPKEFNETIDFFVLLYTGLTNKEEITFSEEALIPQSANFPGAGMSILRDKNNSCYTLFKCGPMGGGHGHDDQLHIEIFCDGETFLADSGRYNYDINLERLFYKGPSMHNTIIIDEENFNEHHEVWSTSKTAPPINHHFYSGDGIQFCEGGHLGYFDLADPVIVNRKVVFLDEGIWLVYDEVFAHGEHTVQFPFHFPDSDILAKEDGKFEVSIRDSKMNVQAFSAAEKFQIEPWLPAIHYNQKGEGKELLCSDKIAGNTAFLHALSNEKLDAKFKRLKVETEGTILGFEEAEAVQINFADGKEKIVLVQHREPHTGRTDYVVEGVHCYGRLIVLSKEKDDKDYSIQTCF